MDDKTLNERLAGWFEPMTDDGFESTMTDLHYNRTEERMSQNTWMVLKPMVLFFVGGFALTVLAWLLMNPTKEVFMESFAWWAFGALYASAGMLAAVIILALVEGL